MSEWVNEGENGSSIYFKKGRLEGKWFNSVGVLLMDDYGGRDREVRYYLCMKFSLVGSHRI